MDARAGRPTVAAMKKTPSACLAGDFAKADTRAKRRPRRVSDTLSEVPAAGPLRVAERALTAREKEILRCLAEGMTTRAVAEKLFISPVTVRNHIQRVLQKLGVHSKLAAVVGAYRKKII